LSPDLLYSQPPARREGKVAASFGSRTGGALIPSPPGGRGGPGGREGGGGRQTCAATAADERAQPAPSSGPDGPPSPPGGEGSRTRPSRRFRQVLVVPFRLQLKRQLRPARGDDPPGGQNMHPVRFDVVKQALIVGDDQHR